jgi:hypothetical protein
VVSVTASEYLPRDLSSYRQAVGCFVIARNGMANSRWEIALAYGPDYQDEHDVYGWAVTVAHELLHLADFHRRYGGRRPVEVPRIQLLKDEEPGQEELIEKTAQDLIDRYCSTHPDAILESDLLLGVRM